VQEKATTDEIAAHKALQKTEVGVIQNEFFLALTREIKKVSLFYQALAKNVVKELNTVLQNKEQWK